MYVEKVLRNMFIYNVMRKVALFFKCYKEEHATDYQQQDSSEEKEKEEVTRTSDDVELDIHCTLRGFWKHRKIGRQGLDKN